MLRALGSFGPPPIFCYLNKKGLIGVDPFVLEGVEKELVKAKNNCGRI